MSTFSKKITDIILFFDNTPRGFRIDTAIIFGFFSRWIGERGGRYGKGRRGKDLFLLLSGHVVAPVHAVEQSKGEREEHTREDVDFLGLELEVLDVVLHPGTENSPIYVVLHPGTENSLCKLVLHPWKENNLS
jgi:hypothetical protein